MGHMEAPSSWKIGRRTKEGNQELQRDCAHPCHVQVVRVLCNDAYGAGEKARDLEKTSSWRSQQVELSTSGVGKKRDPMMRHGSVVRPTMFLASVDIKPAFDEARPRLVATKKESHDQQGWLIAAILHEMSGLEGKAMFECVESSFTFNRCLRQGSVDVLRLWQMIAAQLLASREEKWEQNMGLLLDFKGEGSSHMQLHVGRQLLDCAPRQKKMEQMLRDVGLGTQACESLVGVKTTPQMTRFRDVQQAIIVAAV